MWKYAIQNLARNKRRNVATGVAIGLGFAALLSLGGYIVRANEHLRTHAIYVNRTGHIAIYKKDGLDNYTTKPQSYSLDRHDQTTIERILNDLPGVDAFSAVLVGNGLVGNGCKSLPFFATGIDPEITKWLRHHPEFRGLEGRVEETFYGKGLWDYSPDFGAITISTGLARLLGKTKVVSDFPEGEAPLVFVDCQLPNANELVAADANVQLMSLSWAGMTSALDGEIVGHFSTGLSETNNAAILMPLASLQELYDTDSVTSYAIWLTSHNLVDDTFAKLKNRIDESGLAVDLYKWNNELINPRYTGTVDFLFTLVGFIAAILIAIIAFSILNATTITVIERSQEIGMLRSFGFTRRQVQALFVREMAALTVLSIAVGGVLGAVGAGIVDLADVSFHPPGMVGGIKLELAPNATTLALATGLVVVVAILTNLVAVRRLSKKKVALLLAGEQR